MKNKTKLTLIAIFVFVIGSTFAMKPNKAVAKYDQPQICTHYVPVYNDCIWHPVNCMCDIIVTP